MIFVLDTNSLYSKTWTLDSPILVALIGTAERLGNYVVLPKVVMEEVLKHHSDELKKLYQSINAEHGRYRKMSDRAEPRDLNEAHYDEDLANQRSNVEGMFAGPHAYIAFHPSVSHDVIVDTYAAGKKPFKSDGSGYNDTLIWYSVVALCKAHPEELIVLVTNNSEDFCAGSKKKDQLHPDLVETLEAQAVDPSQVSIVSNLHDCREKYLTPSLAPFDEVVEAIRAGKRFDSYAQFGSVIDVAFLYDSVEGFAQYDPAGFWPQADLVSAHYQEDTEVTSLDALEVLHIAGARYLVSAAVTFSGSFEVEAHLYSDETDLFDLVPDFEQRTASGIVTATLSSSVSFVWDDDNKGAENGAVEVLRFLNLAHSRHSEIG